MKGLLTTKEEANAEIARLLAENKSNLQKAMQLAQQHSLTFQYFDDDRRAEYIPDTATLLREHDWIAENIKDSDKTPEEYVSYHYGISIPGWLSSSSFC